MVPKHAYALNLDLVRRFAHVEGVVVECGTWRGGMIAGMACVLGNQREYLLFDSFEGLPDAQDVDGQSAKAYQANKDSPFYYDNCRAEIEEAREAMSLSGVSKYSLHKGYFHETLPHFPQDRTIAILRLDADWYESTMTCLEHLYPRVAVGGVILIDDYHTWDGCSRALHEYLSRNRLNDRISQWHNDVAYIVKRGETCGS